MNVQQQPRQWSSRLLFLAAAVGSAVGISNIWKFSYVAGENGGGAFVLIYIAALALIALPALIAELLIGRRGGKSVVGTMQALTLRDGLNPAWRYYGLMAIAGVFLALSFYSVVAGWMLDFFRLSLTQGFSDLTVANADHMLTTMQADPVRMVIFQASFVALTAVTVAGGIHRGLERVLSWLTPGLFLILAVLLVYAVVAGDFRAGVAFLFQPDFSKVNANVILMAVGQAFFSLGVGLGVLMTIGAYMNKQTPIVSSAIIIAAADGGVALFAGLAIFPLVFAHGLSPAEGPGLIFATLPLAFGQMPGGAVFGPMFFLLMAFAALTSSITLLEAIVAWLEDYTKFSRVSLTIVTGLALWIVGLATVFSFNIWADYRPLSFIPDMADRTIFGVLDYLVANIMMPLGGFLVAVLAGWGLSRSATLEELGLSDGWAFRVWRWLVRYGVPLAIVTVFAVNLT